jgi:hypothetical protein
MEKAGECENCPDLKRMFYSRGWGCVGYYDTRCITCVWDSHDLENIDDINCASCKTAIREMIKNYKEEK